MFNDWWVAHRLEIYLALILVPVYVVVGFIVTQWNRRVKR